MNQLEDLVKWFVWEPFIFAGWVKDEVNYIRIPCKCSLKSKGFFADILDYWFPLVHEKYIYVDLKNILSYIVLRDNTTELITYYVGHCPKCNQCYVKIKNTTEIMDD